ncbi:MAG: hypothetical protein AB8B91_23575 [Rubripirellula sp.]
MKRKKRRAVYVWIACVALLVACVNIALANVTDGDPVMVNSSADHGMWSKIATLVDGDAAIAGSWLESKTESTYPLTPYSGLAAGAYKGLQRVFRLTLRSDPLITSRLILAMLNLPLLILLLTTTIDSIDRVGRGNWARYSGILAACFATMFLPLVSSLNHQLPAAAATSLVLWIYLVVAERLEESRQVPPRTWVIAGVSAAFAVMFQILAAPMLIAWVVLFRQLDREIATPVIGGVAIALGCFAATWLIGDGLLSRGTQRAAEPELEVVAAFESPLTKPDLSIAKRVRKELTQQQLASAAEELVILAVDQSHWTVEVQQKHYTLVRQIDEWQLLKQNDDVIRLAPAVSESDTASSVTSKPSSIAVLFHGVIGHHGWFSLTPIWLLVPFAVVGGFTFGPTDYRRLAIAVAVVSLVALVIVGAMMIVDGGYRFPTELIWLTPLWLLMLTPLLEDLGKSLQGKSLVLVLLTLSAAGSLAVVTWHSAASLLSYVTL